jgi:hypothetical protein
MTITGVSNSDYVSADLQTRAKSATPTAASEVGIDTISLSMDTINFALSGDADNVQASNSLSLFSVLNANILDYSNLAGVGSAIDKFTNSLASSNVYDSPYTAPSAKYLSDLSELKTAAASGDQAKSESLLATAKIDAPDNVAGGISTAIAKGDIGSEAGLVEEGTANIGDFLATHGYSIAGAATEAAAITINGLALDATNTPTSSAQTRLQQISNLAVYAAESQATPQSGTFATSDNPLFSIISTLIEANGMGPNGLQKVQSGFASTGAAIDQSLTNLEALYGVSTSGPAASNS